MIFNSTPAQINDLLADDLSLTTVLLKQHPKVYWIWNHRYWCLRQVPEGPTEADPNGWRQAYWNKELFVVEKMLDADPRNCKSSGRKTVLWLICLPSPCVELSALRVGGNADQTI